MPFNNADGIYTPVNGAENATPGQVIASATWNSIFTDISENMRASSSVACTVTGINFNSASTDNAITITLPSGYSNFIVSSCRLSSTGGSLSSATCGLFTAASGGGVALITASTAITVTTSSANTNNNAMSFTINNSNTQSYNVSTLYFRVFTAQGSAATGTVTLEYHPIS